VTLARRLGLVGANDDRRLVRVLVGLGLLLYAAGFALFPPRAITNTDEGMYVEQTLAWLELGSVRVSKQDPLSGAVTEIVPGDYPMGMIALMAPFVSAFGWRGAFVPSVLSLLLALLVTARWLSDERRSPFFALVLLGFPALLVVGRMALSDATRTAVAALGLWLFFRGLDRSRAASWLGAGLVAGLALSLRESAVLPIAAFFAGSVLRRDRGWIFLLLGGLGGTALHLAANAAAFGDPFFVRGSQSVGLYPFDVAQLPQRLLLYVLGLLVLVPAGLLFGLAYRGRRRPEVVVTIAGVVGFYLFQAYGGAESGFPKNLVIGLRYFAPLLPLLAFAMAESVPRWLESGARRAPPELRFESRLGAAGLLWLAGVLAASFVVHPALDRFAGSQAEIRSAIDRVVPGDAVLVTNQDALRKFVDHLARPYRTLDRRELDPGELHELARRHQRYFVALLDRSDSDFWRSQSIDNAAFAAQLPEPRLLVDLRPTATDRLRIWEVTAPAGAEEPG
jgi:4-amino-4-deoxy-L-arabinose transferase-like glycosyltransferase